MGVLDRILHSKEELTNEAAQKAVDRDRRARRKRGEETATGHTADGILTNEPQYEGELERIAEHYIADEEKAKIIDTKSALKHGIEKIGTKGDTAGVMGFGPQQLFKGATKAAKKVGAKILSDLWAKKNLVEKIPTKAGKEILGKLVSKNVYIKEVSYMRGAKRIHYLQARSVKTGRVVKMAAAKGLLKRMR